MLISFTICSFLVLIPVISNRSIMRKSRTFCSFSVTNNTRILNRTWTTRFYFIRTAICSRFRVDRERVLFRCIRKCVSPSPCSQGKVFVLTKFFLLLCPVPLLVFIPSHIRDTERNSTPGFIARLLFLSNRVVFEKKRKLKFQRTGNGNSANQVWSFHGRLTRF